MQRLEKMNIVKNRLANINTLYHKFVLIFIFKSRKMDGGRGGGGVTTLHTDSILLQFLC